MICDMQRKIIPCLNMITIILSCTFSTDELNVVQKEEKNVIFFNNILKIL